MTEQSMFTLEQSVFMTKQSKEQGKQRQINVKLIVFSLISLAFIALTFLVNPYFVAGAVLFMLLGQRELGKWRKKKEEEMEKEKTEGKQEMPKQLGSLF